MYELLCVMRSPLLDSAAVVLSKEARMGSFFVRVFVFIPGCLPARSVNGTFLMVAGGLNVLRVTLGRFLR